MQSESSSDQPRLLVVDDETTVLKLMKSMLSRANYDVAICSSGMEGLKLLDKKEFDCIITDAIMPEMSGYDFVKKIRRHPERGAVPILMLTRKRHRQDVKKAVEAGVTDYVLKPIDEHLLLDKVELCLKKGGGKRHIFELPISPEKSEAELSLGVKFLSISETDITVALPLPVESGIPFHLNSQVFKEMGLEVPLIKLIKCEEAADTASNADLRFQAKFAFVGMPDSDLKKIRNWLQKEEIRRKK